MHVVPPRARASTSRFTFPPGRVHGLSPIRLAAALVPGIGLALTTGAATLEPVVTFERPGSQPLAALVRHSDGNWYGTAVAGGAHGFGSIFRVADDGAVSSLASFHGTDGSAPSSELVEGPGGGLFGTASSGGSAGFGVAFRVTTTGELTVLAEFTGASGNAKGAVPGALVAHPDGNFYGTTRGGGSAGLGTVFRMTPAGAVTTLVDFTGSGGARPGASPIGVLAIDGNNLFGVTRDGGAGNAGTLFKVTTTGTWTGIGAFTGVAGAKPGANPTGGLLLNADGQLYGTTEFGGANDFGTAFRIHPATLEFSHLRSFDDPSGSQPVGRLVRGADGQLYGATAAGGADGWGTVFRLTTGGGHAVVASFTGVDGARPGSAPRAGLVPGPNSRLYGTTSAGGPADLGTVYRVSTAGAFEPFAELSPSLGWSPSGAPAVGPAGAMLVPVAFGGSHGAGGIVSVDGSGGASSAAPLAIASGAAPSGALVPAGGEFLGLASMGGMSGRGTAFRYSPGSGTSLVASFPSALGSLPEGPLVRGGDGAYYGLAREGGALGRGTFFKVGTTGAMLRIVSFTGTGGAAKGSIPRGPVALAPDAAFYGVTEAGGSSDGGTIFRVSPVGTFATVAEFSASGPRSPNGGLVVGPDGALYGTTTAGGPTNNGTMIRLVPGESAYSVIGTFTGTGGATPGSRPGGPLTLGPDGKIYGLTTGGGAHGLGTIFRYSPASGLESVISFTGTGGDAPGIATADDGAGLEILGGLAFDGAGILWGAVPAGGMRGGGVIFRVEFSPTGSPLSEWKLAELGDPAAPDNGDPEADGIPILAEYASLLSPTAPDAHRFPQARVRTYPDGERLAIDVPRDPARPDVNIIVEASNSLTDGSWTVLAQSLGGAPFAGPGYVGGETAGNAVRTVEIRDTVPVGSASRRFLRYRVSR